MLRAHGRVVALLQPSMSLYVTAVQGEWVGVSVTLHGQEHLGWVRRTEVSEGAPVAPPVPNIPPPPPPPRPARSEA